MRHPGWIAAATIALLPALANAQPAVRTFDELATQLKPSEDIWVTDRSGTEMKARLADVTATTLTIQTRAGRLDLKADDVVRVRQRRPDPKWNGALIGAAAALAFPVWLCSNSYETGETCGENVQALGFVAVVGAGIGVWIDSMIKGRKVVYERPSGTAGLRIVPQLSRRSIGVCVSLPLTPAAR
jgi:hypothetical protein